MRSRKATMKISNSDSLRLEPQLIQPQHKPPLQSRSRSHISHKPQKRKDTANSAGKITMDKDLTVKTTAETVSEAIEVKTEETTNMATAKKVVTTTTRVATIKIVAGTRATKGSLVATTNTIIDLTSSEISLLASTWSALTSQKWTPTPTTDSTTVMTQSSS